MPTPYINGEPVGSVALLDPLTGALSPRYPVNTSAKSGGNLSVATTATGANFIAFASQALAELVVFNNTGTAVEFRQDGAGTVLQVPAGLSVTFQGIANASQIAMRRVDQSVTPVTAFARWHA